MTLPVVHKLLGSVACHTQVWSVFERNERTDPARFIAGKKSPNNDRAETAAERKQVSE